MSNFISNEIIKISPRHPPWLNSQLTTILKKEKQTGPTIYHNLPKSTAIYTEITAMYRNLH